MIRLTCLYDSIKFEPSQAQCPTGITAATLCGNDLAVSQDGLTLGPVPAELPDGIYNLNVQTQCGCFNAKLYLHRCLAPALVSKHTPTKPDNGIAPECCPKPKDAA